MFAPNIFSLICFLLLTSPQNRSFCSIFNPTGNISFICLSIVGLWAYCRALPCISFCICIWICICVCICLPITGQWAYCWALPYKPLPPLTQTSAACGSTINTKFSVQEKLSVYLSTNTFTTQNKNKTNTNTYINIRCGWLANKYRILSKRKILVYLSINTTAKQNKYKRNTNTRQ